MATSKSAFQDRERGLENEFFHRLDQQLIQRLRHNLEAEQGRALLAQVTGIADPALIDELLAVGIRGECLVALSLVPLVHVAWADTGVSSPERDAILQAAAAKGLDAATPGHQLLDEWLNHKPDDKLFDAWRHYVAAVAEHLSPDQMQKLREEVLRRTREVAEAAGGLLGIGAVSKNEQAAMNEIEAALTS